ncbi:ROK family protein [Nesterenkonia lutea]|uniref:Glucokinase n=1 Tax=Nesterenkonia lutea TaxID=272919 RepID=A0ABR9JFG5_9MICC|nr:ROK family protein [Nesterenkonia lutea]MBE1524665.1 glucokinase [Nesterenkonia lutea]
MPRGLGAAGQRTPDVVLAVDIGGTTVKGSVFVDGAEATAERVAPTCEGSSSSLDTVLAVLSTLDQSARSLGHEPTAIGAASPGFVDTRAGVVRGAVNLGWTELPLGSILATRFGVPAAVDHDARTAARAEMALRPDLRDFIFIPLGTGVSAAVVTAGEMVVGAHGQAGELGHMPVVPLGRACSCGELGCLEAYASASAVLTRYLTAGGSAGSAADVSRLVGEDRLADQVWSEAVQALAKAVVTLTAVLDTEEFIIGGGLAASGPILLDPLRRAVAEMLGWRSAPVISASRAGPRAGVLGAALLGRSAHLSSAHDDPGEQ